MIVSLPHMSGSAWNFSDDKFAAALDAAEVRDTADSRVCLLKMKLPMDRVMLKWVFGNLVIREGEVLPKEKDWFGQWRSYIYTLGLEDAIWNNKVTIHWKCPDHAFPFIGGYCPGLRPDTIISTNADIDQALSHCLLYGIYNLILFVGSDPRLREEVDAGDLQTNVVQWRLYAHSLVSYFNSKASTSGNKLPGKQHSCSFCKSGHIQENMLSKKIAIA